MQQYAIKYFYSVLSVAAINIEHNTQLHTHLAASGKKNKKSVVVFLISRFDFTYFCSVAVDKHLLQCLSTVIERA